MSHYLDPRFFIDPNEGPLVVEVPPGGVPLDNDMRYPGHGLPLRPGDEKPPLQAWARLVRGQPIGKKEILAYNSAVDAGQSSMTTILTIGGQDGSDLDACQLTVTLSQPRVVKAPFTGDGVVGQRQQNASGSYANVDIGAANFPGTSSPIAWVPITAIIEWGLGGTSQRAFCDFSQGLVVNLSASWVRVHAAVSPDAAASAPGTSALYELAAFVGPGWTKPGTAQLTTFLGTINASAESTVFAVPPFAKRAMIISADPEAVGTAPPQLTAAYLRFWQGPTGVTAGKCIANYFQSGNDADGFVVPSGGAYFSVQSSMSINTKFAVVFELAI